MATAISDLLRPGMRVGVGDGVGCPIDLLGELSHAARAVGGIDLLLGWAPAELVGLDLTAFASVRTNMAGYALRRAVDAGSVGYVPIRLGAMPSALAGALRCDLVLASVVRGPEGFRLGTEVSWVTAAMAAGATLLGVERTAVPGLSSVLAPDQVVVVGRSGAPPSVATWGEPTDVHRRIAERVVPFVPAGARIQYGPGPVGTAVLDALREPVRIDTGMVTDPVADLARRGGLLGRPLAPYVAGAEDLYAWAADHVDTAGVEVTHDPVRLGRDPFVAVNTALEIDGDGQVNVEAVGGSAVAGVGGQPDYAGAAARSPHGLSIIAVPAQRGPHPTLVERLSAPASTPDHDVEVVVTEHGVADLRGLDRPARRRAIAALWEGI